MQRRTHPFDFIAVVLLFVLTVGLGLSRVAPTDTGWHLATARAAFSSDSFLGNWPTTNTFSYTYTEYPLYQQYPIYQTILYRAWQLGGFEALSVLACIGFLLSLLLWMLVAGKDPRQYPEIWLLAVLGLQQRMVLRPDLISLLLLPLLLLAIGAYSRGTKSREYWRAALAVLFVQYCWILSHQLFVIGLLIQVLWIGNCILSRLRLPGVSKDAAQLPVLPLCLAFTGSLLLVGCTPLGSAAYVGMAKTFQGLDYLRGHVHELRSLFELPYAATLVAIAAFGYLVVLLQKRQRVSLFEIGVLTLLLTIALVAWRGVGFFVLCASALMVKNLPDTFRTNVAYRYLRTALIAAIVVLTFVVRWSPPLLPIVGQQAGIGKALGQWPDSMMRFFRSSPPPGNGINLSWYLGNSLIWEVFPQFKVFVDPRTEAYPKDFMQRVFLAEESDQELDTLLAEYRPDWFLGELGNKNVQARASALIRSGNWELLYVDPQSFLLVKDTLTTAAYLDRHRRSIEEIFAAVDYESESSVRSQQEERVKAFRQQLATQ